ncbi:MAG TPA: DegT/DnrJ/EryC1/StrS family aminotransferase [Patescibacteria group bacterium]|nr:DegT/DnrJ/EryC1/StrS family aminotransferase [Patescibacteria group bacterium]
MIIREVEKPFFKELFRVSQKSPAESPGKHFDFSADIKIVGSGKGAIAAILKYLMTKKVIKNKLDEVLMADWIGNWVYNQVQSFAFPTKKFSERTKVIMVYHQYGFPQDMNKIMAFALEKKLVVIEDCAHALDSYYQGKKLGSFSDFSIYSFSKWFSCFALGGVRSNFEDFNFFVEGLMNETPFGLTLFKDFAKFLYEKSTFSRKLFFKKYASLLLEMSYAIYGDAIKTSQMARRLLKSKIENEINVRRKRYRYFWDQTKDLGIADYLEKEGVTPYVIPVICHQGIADKLVQKFKERGVISGIYQFDIKRNLLNPEFMPCVWLPCHSSISDKDFSDLIYLTVKTLKNQL